jgi:hypothetical protein
VFLVFVVVVCVLVCGSWGMAGAMPAGGVALCLCAWLMTGTGDERQGLKIDAVINAP